MANKVQLTANRSNPNKLMGGGKTLQASLQRSLFQRGSIMLALLLSVLVNVGWGQGSYTRVNYQFPNTPFINNEQYLPNDLVTIERRYIGLAANGYGQWAVINSTNQPLWALLGNASYDADAQSNPVKSSGMVGYGTLDDGDGFGANFEVKVAANLSGSVRYVCFDRQNQKFLIKGFNDVNFNTTLSGSKQINIAVQDIPKPDVKRSLFEDGIYSYDPVQIPVTQFRQLVDVDIDPEWQDHFDIAMDKRFLYIVYTTYDTQVGGLILQVRVIAIELSSGQVHSNYIAGGLGFRPTVACDVRNNPDNPTFDVGYLLPSQSASSGNWLGAQVMHFQVLSGFVQPPVSLKLKVKQPIALASQFDANNLSIQDYILPFHVRILVSSLQGTQLTPPAKVIYILKYSEFGGSRSDLLLHKFNNTLNKWEDEAQYVDGTKIITSRKGPLNPPLLGGSPYTEGIRYAVINDPIIAFANPYDGKSDNNSFHEFHCLYRLMNEESNAATLGALPLLIVQDDDNGILEQNVSDTRTILSRTRNSNNQVWQPLLSPVNYCGAANQMGIHVYASAAMPPGGGSSDYRLYYHRDKRYFDENIEENTLVTYDCEAKDGTSHQGTQNVTLLGGKMLTLWTDPNFSVSTTPTGTSSGIYLPDPLNPYHHNARLKLTGDNFILNIGQGVGFPASNMYTFPNFKFIFTGSGQKLIVKRSSAMNYAGYINDVTPSDGFFIGNWTSYSQFEGTGTIELIGGGRTDDPHDETMPPSSLIAPAKLNIYGGAVLRLPETISLYAENSQINLFFSQNISPVYGLQTLVNPPATGRAYFHGPVTLDRCEVYSAIPQGEIKNVLFIKPCINTSCGSSDGLTTINCLFKNSSNLGTARLRLDGVVASSFFTKEVEIYRGLFDAFEVSGRKPIDVPISIAEANFQNINNVAINFSRVGNEQDGNGNPVNYNILLKENYFLSYNANNTFGILIENFNIPSIFEDLRIEENDFTFGTGLTGANRVSAAVKLINSSGTVLRNLISGSGYASGIFIEGPQSGAQLNTFICSNKIENCSDGNNTGAGIRTRGWNGIAKLNQVSFSDIGHYVDVNDFGSLFFSRYFENYLTGIKIVVGSNKLRMNGMHDDNNDYAAFDTIDHNNSSSITGFSQRGQITVENETQYSIATQLFLGNSDGSASSATWGHNNFIADHSGDFLIHFKIGDGSGTILDINTMNENYWGYGSWGSLTYHVLSGTSNSTLMPNITYSPSGPTYGVASYVAPFSVTCGTGFESQGTGVRQNQQMYSSTLDAQSECKALYDKGDGYNVAGRYQQAYDTLRAFVEKCANVKVFNGQAIVFGDIDGAVQYRNSKNERFVEYRDWLKSVLYLNTDTGIAGMQYYCRAVQSLWYTYNYNPPTGTDFKAMQAILKYVVDSGKCNLFFTDYENILTGLRKEQYNYYIDTCQDTIATPFDTTWLPTIDEIGMSILRGPQNAVLPITANEPHLGKLIASRNPFTDILELKYRLAKSAMVRIDVYDLLGRAVYSEGQGYKVEGEYVLSLQSKAWASGSYYVRLSSPSGEVKTVKVVKE